MKMVFSITRICFDFQVKFVNYITKNMYISL